MIPERIHVEGFLCYREPQEARFDDRPLWILTGPNGSGKSALFDAVTYTLFGQHRGGRHNARGLIHKACDGFVLEFDFALDDRHYRGRRTLSNQGRATRQMYRRGDATGGTDEHWDPIPETHTDRGFARWVQDHIALSYETFTASVLLLQGKSDSLLTASPAERHRLLSQLVGLDGFERVVQLAKQHLSETLGAVRNLRQQLDRTPNIAEFRLVQLREAVAAARTGHAQAVADVARLQTRHDQSKRWWDLQSQVEPLAREAKRLQAVLDEQSRGQVRHGQWEEVSKRLDQLATLAGALDRSEQGRTMLNHLKSEQDSLRGRLAALEPSAAEMTEAQARASTELEKVRTRESALTRQDAETQAALAATERLRCGGENLQRTRQNIRSATAQLEAAREKHHSASQQLPANDTVAATRAASKAAADQWVRAREACQHLHRRCERFQTVAGEKTCSYCQQRLPDVHVRNERELIEREIKAAQAAVAQRQQLAETTEARLQSMEQAREAALRAQIDAAARIEHLTGELENQKEIEAENQRQCRQACQDLPEPYRPRTTRAGDDWNATEYPTDADVTALRRSQHTVQSDRQQAAAEANRLATVTGQLAEQKQHNNSQQVALQTHLREVGDRVSEAKGDLRYDEQAVESSRAALPDDWQQWEPAKISQMVAQLDRQKASLESNSFDARPDELPAARKRADAVTAHLQVLRDQQRSICPDARCDPSAVEADLRDARDAQREAESLLQASADEEARLTESARLRERLSRDLEAAEREQSLWKRLVTLLGRQHLQRDLLGSAERAIVEYANSALDRLASGQLFLELRGDRASAPRATRTLDLVARSVHAPSDVQDVAFLSGSQKFRVAVALSLAIGQFASASRRPVQAVIIDEGFGCLDTVNRQVMIQELQQLSGHLRRILLVSHEDEFAAAFPDGYRCELVDGTARLTRYP